MSSKEFWKCTPRKLAALCNVHVQLNSTKKDVKKNKGVIPNSISNGVGAPNAFRDQL